jgi:hypothetical protein
MNDVHLSKLLNVKRIVPLLIMPRPASAIAFDIKEASKHRVYVIK